MLISFPDKDPIRSWSHSESQPSQEEEPELEQQSSCSPPNQNYKKIAIHTFKEIEEFIDNVIAIVNTTKEQNKDNSVDKLLQAIRGRMSSFTSA